MNNFAMAKGSHVLRDVAAKNAALNNVLTVRNIKISELKDHPDNQCLFGMEESDILHTALGIEQNGFRGAIEVFDAAGYYEIYSGHIRKYAAIKAGMEEIPCIISPMPEENIRRRLLLGANLFGRNRVKVSNPILTARQLAYHKGTLQMEKFTGDFRQRLADDFQMSGSQVYKYMKLLDLSAELQNVVWTGMVPFTSIYNLAAAPVRFQCDLAALIKARYEDKKDMLTKEEVKNVIRTVEGTQPLPGQTSLFPVMSETVHGEQDKGGNDDEPIGESDTGKNKISTKRDPVNIISKTTVSDIERQLSNLENTISGLSTRVEWSDPYETNRVLHSLMDLFLDLLLDLEGEEEE